MSPELQFGSTPRYWFRGSALKTYVFNALHVILFHGERYMIRTVNECARELPGPEASRLREQVAWFTRQESAHATAHRKFWDTIESEGFGLEPLHRVCRWVGERMLPRWLPRKLNLATTAAIEHNTAVLGLVALRDGIFSGVAPGPRHLLEWHCAEEIEHRSVVFDVLTASGGRSLPLRIAGMVTAIAVLSSLLLYGTLLFAWQDSQKPRNLARDAFALLFGDEALISRGLALGIDYLRPGFHPEQLGGRELALAVLQRPLG